MSPASSQGTRNSLANYEGGRMEAAELEESLVTSPDPVATKKITDVRIKMF